MRIFASLFSIGELLLLTATWCFAHDEVFEEVGQVATCVSYLHVTFHLNSSSLSTLIKDHLVAIITLKHY